MAYPEIAARRPLVWIVLFPFWWYGTLGQQVWACVRAHTAPR